MTQLVALNWLHVYLGLGRFHHHGKCHTLPPVYKLKGSASDPNSYRLIVVLPTMAMVFERVIHSQLYHHILPFSPSTQFGFIRGTGAQDCGTAIALTATQVLEDREEYFRYTLGI